ncbi:MAG: hydrolase [Chloroflexi bacterium]|nr:MAG: hydrolase [Chloroflexota bacterium]RLC77620.1 MAG: hydrolase [Chloroflexota bacterium]
MNNKQRKQALIVDADDTLWENEAYYQQCISDFGELMATLSFDREEAERTVDKVERERIPLTGYGPLQFAENMVIAYEQLCERYEQPVSDAVSSLVIEICQLVMEPPIVLLDGVEETLAWLDGRFRLFLLTKGDREVQESKLARSGLDRFFDGVHVVPEKDAAVFRELIVVYELEPEQTWMIGNSPRSDINPALEAGLGAIHVPHSRTWVLEQEEIAASERVVVLDSFGELAALFSDLGETTGVK